MNFWNASSRRFVLIHGWFLFLFTSAAFAQTGGIAGQVTGPDGKPAAGVNISLLHAASKRRVPAVTDASGRYEAGGLEEGRWFAQAVDVSHRYTARKDIVVRDGQVAANVDLRSGSLALRGIVKDAAGKPLGGTVITAATLDLAPDEFIPALAAISATAGADGTYALTELTPGAYSVAAAGPAHGVMTVTNYSLQADATLDFTFQDSSRMAGHVMDEDGHPVAGAGVQAFRVDPPPAIRSYAMTRADGHYTVLNVGPGLYELAAIARGGQAGVLKGVAVQSGVTSTNHDFTLKRGGGAIRGSVTYGAKALPVAVTLKSATSCLELTARADDRGHYEFDSLPDGDYLLNFSDPSSRDIRATVSAGNTVTIDHEFFGN